MTTPLRVLIVEDSEDDAALLVRELRRAGYEPDHMRVDTLDAMRAALLERIWDVILADFSVPGFGAPQALGLMTALGLDLPFIIVSGSIGEDVAVGMMRAGAQDYVMKGNLTRLTPVLSRELREAEERRERKRAEAALRESEERYRELFENANNIIFTLDLSGRFTSVNKAGEQITGYSRERVLTMSILDLIGEDQRERVLQALRSELTAGEEYAAEWQVNAADGKRVALEVNSRPIFEGEKVVGVQGIARDVTERKRLEAQLRQAQKMESVGTLAGGVAHDFNNILTGIIGFADLGLSDLSIQHPLYRNLLEIKQLGDRAARLIRQLLAFARRQVLEQRQIALNDVISDLGRLLGRVIGEHIELQLVLAENLPCVNADPAQMEQVLMNLCVNARDAMPAGGRLLIETQAITLNDSYCHSHPWAKLGEYVLLTVSDSGMGMDRLTQERIFEPFFTTKEPGQGTGLGLAMVYGIVKQHNGLIHVYSEIGRGSSFKIYLPALSTVGEEVDRPTIELPKGGHEMILLAEDDTAVRELIVTILENNGYRVVAAANGQEAIDIFERQPNDFSLILSDAVMPKISGRELYEALHHHRPALKFLFISGYSINALNEKFILDKRLALLHKPFSPVDLARKVREVLDRSMNSE